MNNLFGFLLSTGPWALLAALVATPVYYLIYRSAPPPGRPASLVGYLLAVFGVAVVAYAAGTVAGIFVVCSLPGAGNLCGLVGVFGIGPLLAAIAAFVYAHRWLTRMRRLSHGNDANPHRS